MFWSSKKYPCKQFYKMGFYRDQSGILRRYNREKINWEGHLNYTKEVITTCVRHRNGGKIAILGSGWLLDIPIAQLLNQFSEVWLIDILHPEKIKKQYCNEQAIHFLETDISGYAMSIFNMAKSKNEILIRDIDELSPVFDIDLSDFNFVVSCNILDQLDEIIVDYLKKKVLLSNEAEFKIRNKIQKSHLKLLPEKKSVLITDINELRVSGSDNIIHNRSLIHFDLSPWKLIKNWTWKFDNSYTYYQNSKTWFEVGAYEI